MQSAAKPDRTSRNKGTVLEPLMWSHLQTEDSSSQQTSMESSRVNAAASASLLSMRMLRTGSLNRRPLSRYLSATWFPVSLFLLMVHASTSQRSSCQQRILHRSQAPANPSSPRKIAFKRKAHRRGPMDSSDTPTRP